MSQNVVLIVSSVQLADQVKASFEDISVNTTQAFDLIKQNMLPIH